MITNETWQPIFELAGLRAGSGRQLKTKLTLWIDKDNKKTLWVSAHIITTLAYLLENAKVPKSQIQTHIEWILNEFVVVPIGTDLLRSARHSRITDYEDAVIEQSFLPCEAKYILTRNLNDFRYSRITAVTPKKYLKVFA